MSSRIAGAPARNPGSDLPFARGTYHSDFRPLFQTAVGSKIHAIHGRASEKVFPAVIKQVHPDLQAKRPLAELQNFESLKVIMPQFRCLLCRSASLTRAHGLDLLQLLNTYIDQLSRGGPLSQQTIWFITVNSKFTNTVDITLPGSGSLTPLLHAFGLMENEERDTQQAVDSGRQADHAFKSMCWYISIDW